MNFWKVALRKTTQYHHDKFLDHNLRYFCQECRYGNCFCGKEHNGGERDGVVAMVCGGGENHNKHWMYVLK